jgi:hypothetical protein
VEGLSVPFWRRYRADISLIPEMTTLTNKDGGNRRIPGTPGGLLVAPWWAPWWRRRKRTVVAAGNSESGQCNITAWDAYARRRYQALQSVMGSLDEVEDQLRRIHGAVR